MMNHLLKLAQNPCFIFFIFLISFSKRSVAQTATYTTPANYNWVCPAGVTTVKVESWGAGGAGGGAGVNKAGSGGGGGGYTIGTTVGVSASASYNVTVGAGGTGSALAGGDGGDSYFNISTAYANGGKGGKRNTNGGGAGGAGIHKGGDGADGSNPTGFSGGGGGGAGSTGDGGSTTAISGGLAGAGAGGGAGANGRNSDGDGSAGNNYGGGGSGGYNVGSGTQSGGDGAGGQVIITWSNPTYSLTGTSVSGSVCQTSTATVNLTGAAANLPTGVYTVTYNFSGNNTVTGNTATMTVTSAGLGSFTTSVLANTGSTTITITKLASGSGGSNGASDGCSSTISTNRTATFTVIAPPAQPSTITGTTTVCQGSTQTYSVTSVSGVTYTWNIPGTGWSIASGQGTNSVTYTVGSVSGSVTVTPSNGCGNGTARSSSITVNPFPAQPGTITGATTVCQGSTQTYSVTSVAGVNYTWNIPGTGWSISSGQGTNSVTYIVGSASGSVTVTPSNGCGSGTASTQAVSLASIPTQPSTITGTTIVCQGSTQSYSVTNMAGVTYTWNLPGAGWSISSGQGTNSVTYIVGSASGSVIVTPSTTCGSGTARSSSITVNPLPTQPGTITGATTVCQGSTQTYSVTNVAGVTYTWNIPGTGWSIASGQGTNSVTYTVGSVSGTIQVTPSTCGNGPVRTTGITVNPIPAQPNTISGATSVCSGSSQTYSVTNVAGVTYTWNTPAGWVLNSGQGTNTVNYTVNSSATIQVTPSNGCGNGTVRTLAIGVNQTLYWAGKGTTMTGGNTGTDFNAPANWSTNASSYVAAGISPTSCNDVVMNIGLNGSTSAVAITFSNTNTSFKNYTSNLIDKLGLGTIYSFSLNLTASQTVTVLGTSTFYTENNKNGPTTQTEINVNGSGCVWTYTGDIIASSVNTGNPASSEADNYIFSNAVGTSNMGKIVIKGNATLSGMGDDTHPELNKPALMVFDGTGTQTIANNNSNSIGYPIYLGFNTQIGEFNTPTVILTGTSTNGFQVIKNLTVSANCTLDITAGQSINDTVTTLGNTGGALTLGSNAILKIGGVSAGQTGSNFPKGFNTYSLASNSTVNYYAGDATTQTVFAGPVYGGLSLTNTTGSGLAYKISTGAISTTGNTTVNSLARFTLGAGFSSSGSFSIPNNAELYCGTNTISGTGSFNLNQGGTLGIGSNAGITTSGATGNIQNSGTRTFNNDANYIYNGSVNQSTGNGLNSTNGTSGTNGVRNLTINNTGTSTNNIVYLSNDVQVNTNLAVTQGILNVGTGNTLYIRNTMSKTSGLINNIDGTLNMNGASAQTITGNIFTDKTVNNLIISNSAAGTVLTVGSTTADSLKIKGLLSFGAVTGKTFATSDNLTLLSTAGYTASVGLLTGNIISGKVSVERYINTGVGGGKHGQSWQLLATPTVGQSVYNSWQEGGASVSGRGAWLTGPTGTTGFDAISAGPSLKYYNSATDSYTGVANTASTITNPNGYYVYIRGDRSVTSAAIAAVPTILRTTGTLYQPTAPAPSVNVSLGKYASVGNPYACPIDIKFMKNNGFFTNLNNDVIVWDPSLAGTYGSGIYQVLSAANNYVPTAGHPSSFYPTGTPYQYIQSGQAFFVHTATGAVSAGTVSFGENIKYLGGSVLANGIDLPDDRQYFRASLHAADGNIADGNAVVFDKNFANSINADDALKLNNSGENFGVKRNGTLLAVEARTLVQTKDTVFYQLTNLKKQAYQFRFGPENMHADIRAVLVDKYLVTNTVLSNTDTSYVNFTVNTDAASGAPDRFFVVFTTQSILPVKIVSVSASRNTDKTVKVNWNVENEINLQGYTIERSTDQVNFSSIGTVLPGNNKGGSYFYSFTDVSAGSLEYYYRIKSRDIDSKYAYSNVTKVSSINTAAFITVYPNPVTDKKLNLQFANQPKGVYTVRLVSENGQTVYEGSVELTSANFSKIILLSKTIQSGVYQLIIENKLIQKSVQNLIIN